MTAFVALLRAVNVGGTGRLPMADLRAMAAEIGFEAAETHLSSGNLLFRAGLGRAAAQAALEARLASYAGKRVAVHLRDAAEMAAIAGANPFPDAAPHSVHAVFLALPPAPTALAEARRVQDEEIAFSPRPGAAEIYIRYPSGSGRSRLVIPAAAEGTARNMNTVTALAAKAAALAGR